MKNRGILIKLILLLGISVAASRSIASKMAVVSWRSAAAGSPEER
jgi:hypothetical protein